MDKLISIPLGAAPSGPESKPEKKSAADIRVGEASPTLSPPVPDEGGESGEGGEGGAAPVEVTNAEFIAAVFHEVPDGATAAVCTKPGDPEAGGWIAQPADDVASACPPGCNNYFNCSSFIPTDNDDLKARKDNFAACHALVLDDVGTKVPRDRLTGIKPSWVIETSPGNFQAGFIFAEPLTDGELATRLLTTLTDAGLGDRGASGPMSRWVRLPVGINGKPKHQDENGKSFQCRLVEWNPEVRYTPEQLLGAFGLSLPEEQPRKHMVVKDDDRTTALAGSVDDVYTPSAEENPVIAELKKRGLYKKPLGSGKHDITCPWVNEHTDSIDHGTAYFEPDDMFPNGGFCCQHSHRDRYHIRQFLDYLDVPPTLARNKPVIRVVQGDMHRVIDAAERVLADQGRHYQSGGLIVTVTTDAVTGDPSTLPVNSASLAKELSMAASWEKFDGRVKDWVPSDPPPRHTSILFESRDYRHLLPLEGVARQPYFREEDGELVTQPGYDPKSRRFGVFDPREFVVPEPTLENAQAALAELEELVVEFPFVSPEDKAGALCAFFTAVTRPSLPLAPAFHVRAPTPASGKSFLCELFGTFAGPAPNPKTSYPKTGEEATKSILALLLTNPAVIEFDDMDADWIPHGVINRTLTATHITDRILGVSKTATVSTRTLVLGSGNNVGPVRDLLRRVLPIHLDPRSSTPATRRYRDDPVARVRNDRGRYVSAVLTVIQAWKAAGSPRADVDSIASYDGAWADYCRHPLIWLGLPDPATALLEQIRHDPDAEALGNLLIEWEAAFGSTPTTVRKAVDSTYSHPTLLDAFREFPIEERGDINHARLGWILKKNANRIIDGREVQKAQADGRTAWRVVKVPETP